MRRDQLEHLVPAICNLLTPPETALIAIGSQSILGSHPDGLPDEVVLSSGLDIVLPEDPQGKKATVVNGSVGEGSAFHDSSGVYVRCVDVSRGRFPEGWRTRMVPVCVGDVTAYCLEPHDLLIAKYMEGREKDRAYCQAVVRADLVKVGILLDRLAMADCTEAERIRVRSQIEQDFRLVATP